MDDLSPDRYHSPTPARSTDPGMFRVGDLERSTACDALAEHYAAGRLDPAELEDRLARAMAARSREDLRALFADLGPRRTVTPVEPTDGSVRPVRTGVAISVATAVMLLALLLAGGMVVLLGAYNPALVLAALVGGTATGVAGFCIAVLVRTTERP